jgi:hypothetical protein
VLTYLNNKNLLPGIGDIMDNEEIDPQVLISNELREGGGKLGARQAKKENKERTSTRKKAKRQTERKE